MKTPIPSRLLIMLLFLLPVVALAGVSVLCEWTANTEPEVTGYKVLIGSTSRNYTRTNAVPGRLSTNVVMQAEDLPAGPVVYLAVVAYSDDGRVSDFSREVAWTNRFSAPANFRVKTTITLDGP